MEKLHTLPSVVRDGKIAVLVSVGHGLGFYTWGAPLEAIVNPTLVGLIEERKVEEAIEFVKKTWPDVYTGGVEDLEVEWVPIGKKFEMREYDGAEWISFMDEIKWIEA